MLQFHEALNAGKADVLDRNDGARKSSASFARGADEDVRAPSSKNLVKLNQYSAGTAVF